MKKKLLLQDFSDYLAKSEGISKRDADSFVRSFFEVIERGLLEDKFVKIKGFGTFKLVSVSERESVNINTGERFKISEHTKISFTPDTTMKDLVNRPFAHFEAVDLNDDTDMKEFEIVDEEMQEEEEEEAEEVAEANEDNATDDTASATSASGPTPESTTEPTASIQAEQPIASPNDQIAAPSNPTSPNTSSEEESATVPHTTEPMPIVSAQPDSSQASTEATEASSAQSESKAQPEASQSGSSAQPSTPSEEQEEDLSAHPASQSEQAQQSASSSTATGKKKQSQPSADEEIVVTPTQPIITPKETDCQQHESHSSATVGYTYTEAPMPRKRNWWKTSAIILGIILLMLGSYFAGYFRIFCPCSLPIIGNTWDANAPAAPAVEKPLPPTPSVQPTDSIQPKRADSAQHPTASPEPQSTAQPAPSQSAPSQPAQVVEKPQPAPTPKPTTPKTAQENARPATHRVKMGDNVYRIARRYYGSDQYAQKIIEANHLKDANTITVGMDLKLP